MFTYDFTVRFIFNKSVVLTSVQFGSNVPDFDYSEDAIIDVAMDSILEDGFDVSGTSAIEVELQGVYGGVDSVYV